MDPDFKKVKDIDGLVQVINPDHVVRVISNPPNWEFHLSNGGEVMLEQSEAEKIVRKLGPPPQAGTV